MVTKNSSIVRLGLPKGRMEQGVLKLLRDASINVSFGSRAYRPTISLPGYETKLQKPQNIIEMLASGSRDIGFAGRDWVAELQVELVELLDTGLDPVRLVAAAPRLMAEQLQLSSCKVGQKLIIASEFQRLTEAWIKQKEINATFLRSYGATEVFPPEDADLIVDITQSGATLEANGLVITDELLRSSTCLFASSAALEDRTKRERIEALVMILRSVLDARERAFLTLNVSKGDLERVISVLPCMRAPTVQPLSDGVGFAVSSAVPYAVLARLIPELKALGGSDLVVTPISQLIP